MPAAMMQKSIDILERGVEFVNSVDYGVSIRWVFYRLLQEGYYSTKSDYQKLIILSSKARKQYLHGWHPQTVEDTTRERIVRAGGMADIQDCIDALVMELTSNVYFPLDHFYRQERYVEIWFEAKAMVGQFQHYTNDIDLVPFVGHPSIPYKYNIAQTLNYRS
jgi:hypothetical protein